MKNFFGVVLSLLFSGQVIASDEYVIHSGLPSQNSPEVVYYFKGKVNQAMDVQAFSAYKVIGPSIFEGNSVVAIKTRSNLKSSMGGFPIDTNETEFANCDSQGCKYWGSKTSPLVFKRPYQVFNVPYKARIGEAGITGVYLNEDNTVDGCAWSLEAAGNDLANLTAVCTEFTGNQVTGYEMTSIIIDQAGNCKSITVETLSEDEDGPLAIVGSGSCNGDKSFLRML